MIHHSDQTLLPMQTNLLMCRACAIVHNEDLISVDDYAYSVPSVGALVEGWVLIFPRRHVLALNTLDEVEWEQFSDHASKVRARVEEAYGASVLFEHGSSGVGRTASCGVDHAHLHIVGISVDLRRAVADIRDQVGAFEWSPASDRAPRDWKSDYIWVEDSTGSWVTQSDILPSQVIRRALAHQMGISDWDWKRAARPELMAKTANRLVNSYKG